MPHLGGSIGNRMPNLGGSIGNHMPNLGGIYTTVGAFKVEIMEIVFNNHL